MKYLTAGEEQVLLDAACGGDVHARNSVIMNMYSLVRRNVGKRFAITDSEREDAVQFVVTVLCEKFYKYDLARRVRYMTYANYWVRYALQQFRIKRRLIPTPKKPVFIASLETTKQEDDPYFQDYLCAPDSSPMQALETADELAELHRVINRLAPREKEIVVRRSQGETLQSIADSLGVARERIRQLEMNALQKMREWFRR